MIGAFGAVAAKLGEQLHYMQLRTLKHPDIHTHKYIPRQGSEHLNEHIWSNVGENVFENVFEHVISLD